MVIHQPATSEAMNPDIHRSSAGILNAEPFALDILPILFRQRGSLVAGTLLITALLLIAVWILPPSYKAEATILPPQQQQSSLSAFASGAISGLGGSSSMASQLGLKNPADLYIGILKSRTISDDIVGQFKLQAIYRTKLESDARKALESHASFTSGKDSLILIGVKDKDPKRAAALANAFVDELYKQNSRLAVTEASQRRLFFEQQIEKEKEALAKAEVALKSAQQSTGLLVPAGQAEVLIRSGAQLRAEIASHQVALQAMRSYETDENASVQIAQKEIAGLQGQLALLESRGASGSKLEVSASNLPEANLEYVRKLRDLKYHETLYELIAKQYEASRIDEAKQAPSIQVIDRAVVPDKSTRPSVFILGLISILAGAILSSISVLAFHGAKKLMLGWTRLQQATALG